VTAIAAGYNHSLALKDDGTVIAWGASKDVPSNLTGVIKIAAGGGRNLAIRANGTVCEWNAPQCSP
jgi:alpha-tubulin suppressor-like RCC1 family protein